MILPFSCCLSSFIQLWIINVLKYSIVWNNKCNIFLIQVFYIHGYF